MRFSKYVIPFLFSTKKLMLSALSLPSLSLQQLSWQLSAINTDHAEATALRGRRRAGQLDAECLRFPPAVCSWKCRAHHCHCGLLLAGSSRCTVRTGALHRGGWQMQEHSFLSMSSIFSLMLFHIYWLLLYSTGLAGRIVTSLPILCFQLRITYVQFQVPQSHFSLHQLQSLAHKHHRYIPAPFLKVTSYAAHQPFLCSQHSPYSLFPNTEQTHGPHLNSFSHFRNWGQTETSATWP